MKLVFSLQSLALLAPRLAANALVLKKQPANNLLNLKNFEEPTKTLLELFPDEFPAIDLLNTLDTSLTGAVDCKDNTTWVPSIQKWFAFNQYTKSYSQSGNTTFPLPPPSWILKTYGSPYARDPVASFKGWVGVDAMKRLGEPGWEATLKTSEATNDDGDVTRKSVKFADYARFLQAVDGVGGKVTANMDDAHKVAAGQLLGGRLQPVLAHFDANYTTSSVAAIRTGLQNYVKKANAWFKNNNFPSTPAEYADATSSWGQGWSNLAQAKYAANMTGQIQTAAELAQYQPVVTYYKGVMSAYANLARANALNSAVKITLAKVYNPADAAVFAALAPDYSDVKASLVCYYDYVTEPTGAEAAINAAANASLMENASLTEEEEASLMEEDNFDEEQQESKYWRR